METSVRTTKRFVPAGESAPAARRFVADALHGFDDHVLFAADLLTGELVANAVLHAGTAIDVEVATSPSGVRIAVTDGAPERAVLLRPADTDAATGRGLQLVEAMSDGSGVEVAGTTKTVWFELRTGGGRRTVSSWQSPAPLASRTVPVRLVDLPVGLSRAAQRHRGALIREAQLALAAGTVGLDVENDDLWATAGLNDLLDAGLEAVYSALSPDTASVSCTVEVPTECGPAAATLAWVLDALNRAAARGIFLTRPALPEVRRYRLWLIGEILRQLDGDPPIPWSRAPASDDQGTAERLDWDAERIHGTDVATVIADDDNCIVAANAAAAELLGWQAAELAGQRLTVIIPPALRERHVTGFTNFLLTGESRVMGLPLRVSALRRDGTAVPVLLTLGVEHSNLGRVVFVGEIRPARLD